MKLELINISKSYNNIKVLDKINLTIDKSGLYFLKGENGSGKTTLLNLINSFIQPDEGAIKINDEKISLDINNKFISTYDVDINLLDEMKVIDNLEFISDNYLELMSKYKLEYILNKKINTISKGEKARVGIIKTLLNNKPIMLFDEPFAYLDKDLAKYFFSLLKEYSKNHIIIFTNHFSEIDLEDVNTITLENGNITTNFTNGNEVVLQNKPLKKHSFF